MIIVERWSLASNGIGINVEYQFYSKHWHLFIKMLQRQTFRFSFPPLSDKIIPSWKLFPFKVFGANKSLGLGVALPNHNHFSHL